MMKDGFTNGCDVKADVPDDQKGRHYDVFEEMSLIAHYLRHQGVFALIEERVRFARRRFGRYELIDFVAVLLGYAISGERTLETFYERLQPFANTFMALFGRDRLPARSTLSRFLAALDQTPVEALRTVFLEDLLARPLEKGEKPGGLWDRQGLSIIRILSGSSSLSRKTIPHNWAIFYVSSGVDQRCSSSPPSSRR